MEEQYKLKGPGMVTLLVTLLILCSIALVFVLVTKGPEPVEISIDKGHKYSASLDDGCQVFFDSELDMLNGLTLLGDSVETAEVRARGAESNVPVEQAFYVWQEGAEQLVSPQVVAFSTREAADEYQQAKGGTIYDLEELLARRRAAQELVGVTVVYVADEHGKVVRDAVLDLLAKYPEQLDVRVLPSNDDGAVARMFAYDLDVDTMIMVVVGGRMEVRVKEGLTQFADYPKDLVCPCKAHEGSWKMTQLAEYLEGLLGTEKRADRRASGGGA